MNVLRRRFTSASPTNRHIAASLCVLTLLTLLARMVETGREIVLANNFGVSEVVDAYVVAFLVPKFLLIVVADAFAVAFLPSYMTAKEAEGRRGAGALLVKATIALALGLLVLAMALAVARPVVLELLAPNFAQEKLELTSSLFLLLLPVLVLSGCSRLWTMALNAGEHYAVTSLVPAVVPLVGIISLVAVPGLGIQALAVGTVAGSAIETAILAARVRLPQPASGRQIAPMALRRTLQDWWPLALSSSLMASTILVDQLMAARLGAGSVSTLAFGNKLVMFMVGIGSVALSAALFPRFASLVVTRDWAQLGASLRTWTRIVTMVSVPVTLILILLSPLIVSVAFERGDFSATDTAAVAGVQALYLVQLPFYLVATLCVRVLNALGCNRWLTAVASVSVVLNVIGNLALTPLLGVSGIALSTSLVYASSTTLIVLLVRRELGWRQKSTRDTEHQRCVVSGQGTLTNEACASRPPRSSELSGLSRLDS